MSDLQKSAGDLIGSELIKDDPSFADLVVEFVDSLPDRLHTMNEAIRESDFEVLRVAAHQLKGSGGGYGYPVLTERAAVLEQGAKRQAFDECANAFSELKNICARIVVDDQHPPA